MGGIVPLVQSTGAHAQETLKLGFSAPLSGPGAPWGNGFVWTANQAAQEINSKGGIKAAGKTYMVEIVAYDNKYNATEGAKVAQTLINRDNIQFVAGTIATPSVSALQAISERKGVLHFTGAWGKRLRGKEFPLTYTMLNSPAEILEPLYRTILERHPNIKTVALVNPNDATGQDVEKIAVAIWRKLGVEVVTSEWHERDAIDFSPLVTKLVGRKPDAIELATEPPATAGQILRELEVQGWKGVKLVSAGASSAAIVKSAGTAAEKVYMGLAADFDAPTATDSQRRLNAASKKERGEPLDQVTISTWDSVMAIKAAIEKANSIDPRKVAALLPSLRFESSYGPSGFGLEQEYGTPNQMLLPVIVSQIVNGKTSEIKRVLPSELIEKLKAH